MFLFFFLFQGTQEKLKNNKNAKAVVSAIIDGTGSIGIQ